MDGDLVSNDKTESGLQSDSLIRHLEGPRVLRGGLLLCAIKQETNYQIQIHSEFNRVQLWNNFPDTFRKWSGIEFSQSASCKVVTEHPCVPNFFFCAAIIWRRE